MLGIDFYDANNGYAVGGDITANTGKMLATTDGGATWTNITLNSGTARLARIDMVDQNTGYAVGLNGVILKYSSCPPGNGWTAQTSGITMGLIGVSAPSSTVCYVSGSSGKILKTINGGTSWIPQTSGSTEDLYSIIFTDLNNGYAVGNNGAALKTIDGGTTWTSMPVGTSPGIGFRCIFFFNATTGYITGGIGGSPGVILKTTDAGATWTSLTTSGASVNSIYSIYFTSSTDGYANDYSGHILKTTDGGTSWTSFSAGTTNPLTGTIYFTSATTGYVSGMNGAILKTSNSGASWSALTSGSTTDDMLGIDFYDANNGYAVGGDITANTGKMLATTDGGATWTNVTLNSGTASLARIDMVDQNIGYAVGLNGVILKYAACPVLTIGIPIYNTHNNNDSYNSFSVYPNPFNTSTIIDLSNHHFEGEASIELFDVAGKLMKRNEKINTDKFILERNMLPSGFYFFKVYDLKRIVGGGKVLIE
jgi:photosystem II stability/assembly factor-like uncharacterized protein